MSSIPSIYLIYHFLCCPLEALFTLLIFILSKEEGASPWQLTLIACLKPIMSICAFQLSSFLNGRSGQIKHYLIVISLVGCLPCFLFLSTSNIWFYITSYALFIATQRATLPAWNEILKEKVAMDHFRYLVAKVTSFKYSMIVFIPFCCSFWMDTNPGIWKFLFLLLAALQLLATIILFFLEPIKTQPTENSQSSCNPWKNGFKLLFKRPDFAEYLLMFFLGGMGLIAIQPFVPIFFNEELHLSYKELTFVFSLCKGTGFLFTSFLWAKISKEISLFRLNGYMNFFSLLFFIFLVCSFSNKFCLLLAFLFYGIMQAGCEISWNLSGPLFSKEQESCLFSSLNLALVGIRGCICPLLAQFIFVYTDLLTLFLLAGCICFLSLIYAFQLDKKHHPKIFHVI